MRLTGQWITAPYKHSHINKPSSSEGGRERERERGPLDWFIKINEVAAFNFSA